MSQDPTRPGPLDLEFTVPLQRSEATGGWTYVVWPQSAAVFGTRGLVKVSGTVDGVAISTSFMALGGGHHKLPVKGEVLRAIHKAAGDEVSVHLTRRH